MMIIYMTQRNSDMTEGRGTMVNDLAFMNYKDACDYIDSKPGCMGFRKAWSKEKYGDWCIVEIEVRESAYDEQFEAKLKALAKLTKEERELLGLN